MSFLSAEEVDRIYALADASGDGRDKATFTPNINEAYRKLACVTAAQAPHPPHPKDGKLRILFLHGFCGSAQLAERYQIVGLRAAFY